MATQAICTSFKQDLLNKRQNLASGGDSFKMSLYTSSSTNGAATTAYTATNEISGTGYVATGQVLGSQAVATSGTTVFVDFADEDWTTATFTANSALIYNDTLTSPVADASVSVHTFGGDQTVAAGTFRVQFPVADASNAIIRLA